MLVKQVRTVEHVPRWGLLLLNTYYIILISHNYKLKKMSTSTARYWNSSFFLQRDVFYLATETKTNCFARLVLYVMLPIHGPEILRGKTVQSRPSVFPERLW
jgi:hypothetical protein